jgi:hypothetical protein
MYYQRLKKGIQLRLKPSYRHRILPEHAGRPLMLVVLLLTHFVQATGRNKLPQNRLLQHLSPLLIRPPSNITISPFHVIPSMNISLAKLLDPAYTR